MLDFSFWYFLIYFDVPRALYINNVWYIFKVFGLHVVFIFDIFLYHAYMLCFCLLIYIGVILDACWYHLCRHLILHLGYMFVSILSCWCYRSDTHKAFNFLNTWCLAVPFDTFWYIYVYSVSCILTIFDTFLRCVGCMHVSILILFTTTTTTTTTITTATNTSTYPWPSVLWQVLLLFLSPSHSYY